MVSIAMVLLAAIPVFSPELIEEEDVLLSEQGAVVERDDEEDGEFWFDSDVISDCGDDVLVEDEA